MKIFITFVFAVFIISVGFTEARVKFCESEVGSCLNVTVSGCPETAAACPLKRGTSVGITMKFTADESTSAVKAVVHGIVAGVPIPFHLPNPDACKDCGLTCPLKKGSSYTYAEKLPIKKQYPAMPVEVKWELKDADANVICCALIPSRIV